MNKSRIVFGLAGLCVLDLIAIAAGASLPDLYLRPLVLLCMAGSVLFLAGRRGPALLIAVGLFAAAFVEVFQMLGVSIRLVAVGTALYYLGYAAAFLIRGGRLQVRDLYGFGGMAVYAIGMFIWLEPYGLLRLPSVVYTVVLILFAGLGLRPILHGSSDNSARWMAASVLLLAFSDSLRAISIFKMAVPEAATLAFYWAGQFAIVRSSEFFSQKVEK